MFKKLIPTLLLIILLASTTLAIDTTDPTEIQAQLDVLKEMYNSHMDKVPSFFKTTFGNERANIYIKVYVQDVELYAITEKAYMQELSIGLLDDPTMNIYTDIQTIAEIAEGRLDPIDAINEGKIQYEAVGFTNKVKYGLLGIGLKISSFFRK